MDVGMMWFLRWGARGKGSEGEEKGKEGGVRACKAGTGAAGRVKQLRFECTCSGCQEPALAARLVPRHGPPSVTTCPRGPIEHAHGRGRMHLAQWSPIGPDEHIGGGPHLGSL